SPWMMTGTSIRDLSFGMVKLVFGEVASCPAAVPRRWVVKVTPVLVLGTDSDAVSRIVREPSAAVPSMTDTWGMVRLGTCRSWISWPLSPESGGISTTWRTNGHGG